MCYLKINEFLFYWFRETPTSTGPNSFGKGRLGFCDRNSLFQRELKKKMEEVCDD